MCTWTRGNAFIEPSWLTAGGEEPDHVRRGVGPTRVIDVTLFLAARNEPGAAQQVEMVRERGPGDLELGLDLSGGDLAARADEKEEDLEPGEMPERLERLDVGLARLELRERERLHILIVIEIST